MEEENPDNGVSDSASPPPSFSSSPSPSPSPVCAAFFSFRSLAFSVSGEANFIMLQSHAGIKSYQCSCCLIVHCKSKNNFFRLNGRQDGYEALESESFREGSLLQSLDETSKIRNGFADLFDQFQSFGDESQNNVTF